MGLLEKLFSKYLPNPDRDVRDLSSDRVSDRAGAAHLLKQAADEGDLRSDHLPHVARALQRQGESLITAKFLMGILAKFEDQESARAGINAYLANASRRVLAEEHASLAKMSAILEIEQMLDVTPIHTAGGQLLGLALRRMVLDGNVRYWYRFRCFRVLRRIDESFLAELDDEDRAFFSQWSDTFQTNDALLRSTLKAVSKVTLKAAVVGITDGLIDSHVGSDFSFVAKAIRDNAIKGKSVPLRFQTIQLSQGRTLELPDFESLPDSELFGTIESIIGAVAESLSRLPR
ncbi:MAG: hypothetical protein U9N47_08580 [Thermodesulfobacteriota bacterium]|nr:hypothetical protein [Thermodesulfobacteriota bacterium]